MMRIVFYTSASYVDSAFPLVSAMSRRAEVHLIVEIAPESKGNGPFTLPSRRLLDGLVPMESVPECLLPEVRSSMSGLASFHLVVFNARRAFDPRGFLVCWHVAQFIRAAKADILHFDETTSRALAIPFVLPRLPVVIGFHDSTPHSGESLGPREPLVRKFLLQRSRGVIFHSRYSQETYPDRNGLRNKIVRVVPLGIFGLFDGAGPLLQIEEDHTALFFGRISPYKGLEHLFGAAPLVATQVPDFRLIVAGRPIDGYEVPPRPPLPSGAAAEYRLRRIPDEEMAELYRRASLVVLPYLDATQSGVISMAYAFGKPVVATAVGGLPEMVEDGVTGRLVPPKDPEALAAAIAELLLDRELRSRMSENVRRKAEGELSWSRLVDETLDLYRDVASDHGTSAGAGREENDVAGHEAS